ncbi:MAG: DnaJ domain-containing protein, partial [SAR324 cluster bacterium]|nr:DnaJ domain-containing protein [SAR324 cluster bacterium]
VYHSRKAFEETARRDAWEQSRRAHGNGGNHRRPYRAGNFRAAEEAYFQTLGLESSASLMEVKNAYREKVKQHHPDQGGSVREFLRLQEAYEYLLTQVF